MVNAPERLAPPQPGEPKLPAKRPRRRRLLALGLTGGLALGGGGAALALSGSEKSRPPVPSEKRVTPTTELTQGEQLTSQEKQIKQLEKNIKKAFALTDEEIAQYGAANPLSYRGVPWGFPIWYNHTDYTDDNGVTNLMYDKNYVVPVEPNFSIVGTSIEEQSYAFLAIRLGSITNTLSNDNASIQIGAYYVDLPSSLGNSKFIIFGIENVNDPTDQRFSKDGPLSMIGDSPPIITFSQEGDLTDSRSEETVVSRDDLFKQLKIRTDQPVMVSFGLNSSPEEDKIVPGLSQSQIALKKFYSNFLYLFQNKPELFNEGLEEAVSAGLIMTPDQLDLPSILSESGHSFEEYLNLFPFFRVGFPKGQVAPILSTAKN